MTDLISITSPPYEEAIQDKRDRLPFNGEFKDVAHLENRVNHGKEINLSIQTTKVISAS